MAKSTAAIEIEVVPKGNAESTVKSFKTQLKEAKIEAQQLVATFGEFSNEALAGQQKVANLSDQMEDFNDRVKALNPDKFAKVQTVVNGVASGFSAAQGAMALFGSESEDLQKTLVKVQGAMALAQGLEGLGKVQQQFMTIGKTIGGQVLTAVRSFGTTVKSTLISTGIGAFVVLLGTMVAYWDEIKAAVSGVSDAQKKNLANIQKSVTAEEGKLETLNDQENILKQQGKTEEQILKIKIAQTKAVITQLENQLIAQEQIKKVQVETARENQKILQNVIRLLFIPLSVLLKQIDLIGETLGKNFGLEEKFSGGLAKLVFDEKEVTAEADKGIAATRKQLTKARNEVAGYELQITGIKTKESETRKAASDKEAEDALTRQAELAAINAKTISEQIAAADAEFATRVKGLKEQGYTQVEINKLRDAALEKVREDYAAKLKSDEEKLFATQKADTDAANQNLLKAYDEYYGEQILKAKESGKTKEQIERDVQLLEIQNLEDKLVSLKDSGDATIEIETQIFEKKKAIRDKDLADQEAKAAKEKEIENAKFQAVSNSLTAIADIYTAFASANEEEQKKAFEVSKAISIAQAIMNTWQGVSSALAMKPENELFAGQRFVNAGLALAAGLVSVKKISDTKFQSKSTQGGNMPSQSSGGGMQQMAAPRMSSLGNGNELTQDRRVYVTEGDISRTQKRVSNNQSVSVVE